MYTDGSKLEGKVIYRQGTTIAEHKTRLPNAATVYQAEVQAIKDAADILCGIGDLTTIKIFVNSQAALQTL